jgi:hypothetical protein
MKWILICAALALSIMFGFYQENVKIDINYQLEFGEKYPGFFQQTPEIRKQMIQEKTPYAPFDYYYSHPRIEWLNHFSQEQLGIAKWIWTLIATMVFLFFNGCILYLLYRERILLRWLIFAYSGAFALALVIFACGKIVGHQDEFYAISRKVMGALQSLVPVMIFIPAWRLYKKSPQS